MTDIQRIDQEIRGLIDSPETHFWIANAMRTALSKDPLDASSNFEVAYKLFYKRFQAMTIGAMVNK